MIQLPSFIHIQTRLTIHHTPSCTVTVPIYIPHPDVPYYSVQPLPFLEFLFYILTEYSLIVHNTTSRFEVYFDSLCLSVIDSVFVS